MYWYPQSSIGASLLIHEACSFHTMCAPKTSKMTRCTDTLQSWKLCDALCWLMQLLTALGAIVPVPGRNFVSSMHLAPFH
jgi:hypothetical protein